MTAVELDRLDLELAAPHLPLPAGGIASSAAQTMYALGAVGMHAIGLGSTLNVRAWERSRRARPAAGRGYCRSCAACCGSGQRERSNSSRILDSPKPGPNASGGRSRNARPGWGTYALK